MKVLLIFFLVPFSVVAETIALSSYTIPGLVSSKTQGPMIELLKEIEKQSDFSFDLTIAPIWRVQLSFKHEKITGYFPELEEFRPLNSCRTHAFMKKNIIAVTRVNDQLVTNVKQLEERKVGAVSGFSYGKNIVENPNITLDRVYNDDANLKKLILGRIDIIIGDAHSTISAIKAANLESELRYDVEYPINQLDVFFVFLPDTDGQNRCTYLSEEIEKLRKNGKLTQLFG